MAAAAPLQQTAYPLVLYDFKASHGFLHLLDHLLKQLTSAGLSITTERKLVQARTSLREARRQLNRLTVVLRSIREVVMHKEILSLEQQQVCRQVILHAEALQHSYLKTTIREAPIRLPGLSCFAFPLPGHQEIFQKSLPQLLLAVEDNLKQQCIRMARINDIQFAQGSIIESTYRPRWVWGIWKSIDQQILRKFFDSIPDRIQAVISAEENASLLLARSALLPSIVANCLESCAGKEETITRLQLEQCEMYRRIVTVHREKVRLLLDHAQHLGLPRLREQDRVDTITLLTRLDTLALKLRVITMQLQCDTYTASSVEALGVIRASLDTALSTCRAERSRIQQALHVYHTVGSEFEELLETYLGLRTEIDNKVWALAEAKKLGA